MTTEWLEYYNKERPHSSLGNHSPQLYREEDVTPLGGEYLTRFFRSAAAHGAPSSRSGRNAHASNHAKNGFTSEDTE